MLLVTLLITVAAGWAAIGWLGFDTNILELLPEDAESVRYQRLMAMESDLSPMFNIVAAEDLETLREAFLAPLRDGAVGGEDRS